MLLFSECIGDSALTALSTPDLSDAKGFRSPYRFPAASPQPPPSTPAKANALPRYGDHAANAHEYPGESEVRISLTCVAVTPNGLHRVYPPAHVSRPYSSFSRERPGPAASHGNASPNSVKAT